MLVICCCVGCDQSTKIAARKFLSRSAPLVFWNETVRLQYAENSGAFLGFGSSLPKNVRFLIFILLPVIGLILLLFLLVGPAKKLLWAEVLSISLIIGGGFSNLFDRFWHDGIVIDFMNVGLGNFRTGVFNVADVAIMAGIAYFVLLSGYDKLKYNMKKEA